MKFIQGDIARDARGQIRFVNDFDMSAVKRFYLIRNADLEVVRGWRAHKLERRWFFAVSGSFKIELVKIDNWIKPSNDLAIIEVILTEGANQILEIPMGFGSAITSLEMKSELLVYADFGKDHAEIDDYTYPLDYFGKNI